MHDLSKRIRTLSPEKRKLLEHLLREKGVSPDLTLGLMNKARTPANLTQESSENTSDRPNADNSVLWLDPSASPAETKKINRRFYDSVSKQLDSALFGSYSFFLNFGYVPNDNLQLSRIKLPQHYLNKNCVKLITEVVADCGLSGRCLLDVGCGRGGTVHVINKFYDAQRVVGMDLSSTAIAFCRRTHKYAGVSFLEGDAEQLPFTNGSFDVVTNVESSHSYPGIPDFYKEVFRVLKPGGYFLYTDLLSTTLLHHCKQLLQDLGFLIEQERDITTNVLLSCDETARSHLNAFDRGNDAQLINNFLGVPGSQVYTEMRSGKSSYRIFKLAKGSL